MKKLITIFLIIVLPVKVGSKHKSYFDSVLLDTPDFLKVGLVKMPDLLRFDAIHNRMEKKYERAKTRSDFEAWKEASGINASPRE